MEPFLKYCNLNEMAIRRVQQADGSVTEIPTQHHAEASLITHGPKPTKSGSTLPDLEVHFDDGSKIESEVKSGRNVDYAQMTVNMDPEGKDVTFSGPAATKAKAGLEAHGIAKRIMNHLGRRVGSVVDHHAEAQSRSSQHHDFLTDKHKEYTQQYVDQGHELTDAKKKSIADIKTKHPEESKYVHTSSKEIKSLTGMGSSMAHLTGGLGQKEIRKKMPNSMVYDYIHNHEDSVQKHIHQGTGEIVVFPVSNEHRKHTDRMGLKGQMSLEDIVNHPEERRSSLGVMARLRRKEKRGVLSVTGDSSRFVDAWKRRGGKVFANADEYKAHAAEHGYEVRSGQFPNNPPETVNEETSVMNEVTTKLTEVINPLRLQGALTYRDMFVDLFGGKKADDKTDDKTDPIDLRQSDKVKRLSLLDPKNVPTIDISGPTSVTGYNPVALDDILGQLEDQDKAAKAASKSAREQGQFGTKFGSAERDAEYRRRTDGRAAIEDAEYRRRTDGRAAIEDAEYRRRTEARARNESVFHIASVLHEDDENYSDDEIARDKDPNAAGGPYSEDDIKVTQDPRDAAPGMDPVADPPTQQAKQVTTGMASKAPAAAGTMQTMLPGGEHDAIMNQYPDLIEGLCGGKSDMKGGFLTDPKDKKKAAAAFALMASLDKKLKEDKAARLSKILNNNKPPAIPGSEGY